MYVLHAFTEIVSYRTCKIKSQARRYWSCIFLWSPQKDIILTSYWKYETVYKKIENSKKKKNKSKESKNKKKRKNI